MKIDKQKMLVKKLHENNAPARRDAETLRRIRERRYYGGRDLGYQY